LFSWLWSTPVDFLGGFVVSLTVSIAAGIRRSGAEVLTPHVQGGTKGDAASVSRHERTISSLVVKDTERS